MTTSFVLLFLGVQGRRPSYIQTPAKGWFVIDSIEAMGKGSIPLTSGAAPAPFNDCGGVDSDTHALERLGVKHSAVPIGSREDGERISMRPTSLEQNPSRCNSGPQSPITTVRRAA